MDYYRQLVKDSVDTGMAIGGFVKPGSAKAKFYEAIADELGGTIKWEPIFGVSEAVAGVFVPTVTKAYDRD